MKQLKTDDRITWRLSPDSATHTGIVLAMMPGGAYRVEEDNSQTIHNVRPASIIWHIETN